MSKEYQDSEYQEGPPEDHQQYLRYASYAGRVVLVGLLLLVIFGSGMIGFNSVPNWQVVQYPWGAVEIRDRPGVYLKWFAKVTTYPRVIEVEGSPEPTETSPDDDSVLVRFNDGGRANISWLARVSLPTDEEGRRQFHRQFVGQVDNARDAVRSYLRNIITQTGPIMSSSEHQSARKAEFWRVIHAQFSDGFFKMKRVERKTESGISDLLAAQTKENKLPGEAVKPVIDKGTKDNILTELKSSETVVAAEIVLDDNDQPVIAKPSPLDKYGMSPLQFSITESDYDASTQGQFRAKKQDYLQAEKSKASAIEFAQSTLLRKAQGDREITEREWEGRVEQAKVRIGAELKKEVEEINKERLSVQAETKVLIREENRKEEEIKQQIAGINAQIADVTKQIETVKANAREQELELAGAISVHEQTLLEIAVAEDEEIAEAMANIQVPDVVILGKDAFDPNQGTALEQALPSFRLLKLFGITSDQQGELKVEPRKVVKVPAKKSALTATKETQPVTKETSPTE